MLPTLAFCYSEDEVIPVSKVIWSTIAKYGDLFMKSHSSQTFLKSRIDICFFTHIPKYLKL